MSAYPIALQLYTVRDHCERDLPGTLRRVKEMGYNRVELADCRGLSPHDCKQHLDDAGLTPVCSHVPFEQLRDDIDSVYTLCKALNLEYICCPYLAPEHHPARRHWKRAARVLATAGNALAQKGITLCYHNHAHEFRTIWGKYIFDIVMDTAGKQSLAAELDIYWIRHGGADPISVIARYAGRCPLIHLKDMAPGPDRAFAEVGSGTMDWATLLPATKQAGARWYMVEQDECVGDSLESAAKSFNYLKDNFDIE